MITKRVKIIEQSMFGKKTIDEYERTFEDEREIRGFYLTTDEQLNLNSVLKRHVELEDI